jgi:hypothetical protein
MLKTGFATLVDLVEGSPQGVDKDSYKLRRLRSLVGVGVLPLAATLDGGATAHADRSVPQIPSTFPPLYAELWNIALAQGNRTLCFIYHFCIYTVKGKPESTLLSSWSPDCTPFSPRSAPCCPSQEAAVKSTK